MRSRRNRASAKRSPVLENSDAQICDPRNSSRSSLVFRLALFPPVETILLKSLVSIVFAERQQAYMQSVLVFTSPIASHLLGVCKREEDVYSEWR